MKKAFAVWILVSVLICGSSPLLQAQQSSLTGEQVSRFLADFPGFVKLLQEIEGVNGEKASEYLTAQWQAAEVNRYLEKRGWDPGGFSTVCNRIIQAFGALQYQKARAEGATEMAEANKQMEAAMKDPSLTPEMKAMLQQNMAAAKMQMQQNPFAHVPEGDISAVRPHAAEIETMFKGLSLDE
ncbi:MAG: hypothetical protein JW821_00680 [Deltaproteobacteria bacterium]|nr:hypothetical protein [Deltaproteobacteria bacterium]